MTNSISLPGTASGQSTVNSVAEAERTGVAFPLAHTLVPASSTEAPEPSAAAGAAVSHLPSTAAMAPGLHAASCDRLAALTTRVTIGVPESTCTVTEAL